VKNIIVQYFLQFNGNGAKAVEGKNYGSHNIPIWASLSSNKFLDYSKKVNAEYMFWDTRYVNAVSNFFESVRLFTDPALDVYDKLLFVDVDVFPMLNAPNIFDIDVIDIAGVNEQNFNGCLLNHNVWNTQKEHLEKRYNHFGTSVVLNKDSNVRMINSGVMLWSRQARIKARQKFINWNDWYNYKNKIVNSKYGKEFPHRAHCLDQPYYNAMFNKFEFDIIEIDRRWNHGPVKTDNRSCYFSHLQGHYKHLAEELYK
jgi:hypothetical protein